MDARKDDGMVGVGAAPVAAQAVLHMRSVFVLVALFQLYSTAMGVLDNRCFLENGASSDTIFVSEAQPVGSLIGHIHVHGDPSSHPPTISLRLRDPEGSPVAISPHSKNLTLRRKLDKEGIEGPSTVFLSVICERSHTTEPGIVIPINIRVTDANDNAPKFINSPYVLNISEVTVIGTRVLQGVHAIDHDQQGPFSSVRYRVLPGPHAQFFEFENELEGTLVLRKLLDYETLKQFDVNIRALDHGESPRWSDTVLTVNVLDADDQNPIFLDERYTATVNASAHWVRGTEIPIAPRPIRAVDQDRGIMAPVFYTFNGATSDHTPFHIDKLSGVVRVSADGPLEIGSPVIVLVVRATQQDNSDRYALATLVITVVKSDVDVAINRLSGDHPGTAIRFHQRMYNLKVSEALPVGSVVGHLTTSQPNKPLRYFVSDQHILKVFALNARGQLTLRRRLDFEETPQFYFKVFATDGVTNDSAVVNVSVQDVNEWEPRFRYPHYEFYITGDMAHQLVGLVEAADGDDHDKLSLNVIGANSSLFSISPAGELRLKQPLQKNKNDSNDAEMLITFQVIATDSGVPPKTATVPVSVHVGRQYQSRSLSTQLRKVHHSSSTLLLAVFGAILLVLTSVIVALISYIWIAKRNERTGLPSLNSLKQKPCSQLLTIGQSKVNAANSVNDRVCNPMFGGNGVGGGNLTIGLTVPNHTSSQRSPMASAMGGIPSGIDMKPRIISPKIHPAPLPPPLLWTGADTTGLPNVTPGSSARTRKKLSWGDKTDSDNSSSAGETSNNNVTEQCESAKQLPPQDPIEHSNLTVYF